MGDEEMENALLRKLARAQAVIIKELWEHLPPSAQRTGQRATRHRLFEKSAGAIRRR